jgi:hypothetical protein
MQGRIDRTIALNFRCSAPQSADYGFSGIVIESDPANHRGTPRMSRAGLTARELLIVP